MKHSKVASKKLVKNSKKARKKTFNATDGGGEGGTSGNWGGGATVGSESEKEAPLTYIDALGTQHFNPR